MLLFLEFCCLVELVSQLEQTFGKTMGCFRLVAFDLLFGISPYLISFLDVFSESDSHLMNFVVSFLVEFLLFFKLKLKGRYFGLETLNILLLFRDGFLCSGHSFDELSNFYMVFMGPCGGEGDEEDSFEH